MIDYPEGFDNLLSIPIISVFPAIWLTDGIGWILASRHSDTPARFMRVGLVSFIAGTLWLMAGCLYRYVTWEVSYTMLSLSWVLSLAGLLRYFIWSENWRPVHRIISHIGKSRILYDVPEVIILTIAWLISLSSLGKGVFTGSSLFFWNIAGSISTVRVFDLPAAVGIGADPITRLIFLWFARISLIAAILLKLLL